MAAAFEILGSPVTWLEILAFWLSVWMVVLNMRVHSGAWPLAIVASALYGLLFWDSGLYGEASLQGVFIAAAGWGWWQWLRGLDHGRPLVVRRLDRRSRWVSLAVALLAWPMLGIFLQRHTDSTVPYLDALPTVGSLLGQWLLGRKYVENWPVWIAVNAFSVGLFAYKGLWLTVVLYALFIPLALAGWRAWQRLLTAPAAPAAL
jgi:nicotinamide mononucleotide transporter